MSLRGQTFSNLGDEVKLGVWRYAFSVEFVEQENESLINDIFNRINKNVAKLSPQELRHAKFSGRLIISAESITELFEARLPPNFPNIAPQSRRQMKDVENVANILLFVENGERSISQADLDKAFAEREDEWQNEQTVIQTCRRTLDYLSAMLEEAGGSAIPSTRLRNQADFYSLFGAIVELLREDDHPSPVESASRLLHWISRLRDVERGDIPVESEPTIARYLDAARAASNDAGPRRTRIDIIKGVLKVA